MKAPDSGGARLPARCAATAHDARADAPPAVWSLPIRPRWRDVIRDALRGARSVLDTGAGNRHLAARIAEWYPDMLYRSMDVDRATLHDYYDLADVDRTFDAAVAVEVIEHVGAAQARALVEQVSGLLNPGGQLILTTPNTHYPPAYLRDATHRSPFSPEALARLVEDAGFRVHELVRIYNHPFHRKLAHRWLLGWVHRVTGIDYAKQLVLIARKPHAGRVGET